MHASCDHNVFQLLESWKASSITHIKGFVNRPKKQKQRQRDKSNIGKKIALIYASPN